MTLALAQREITPALNDEQARDQVLALYDEAAARGEVQLRDPALRRDFQRYVQLL